VVVGYGLTETSPVICNRVAEHNLKGSVGLPPPGTTIKLVHPETRETVPKGQIGVVCAKGPQVYIVYYIVYVYVYCKLNNTDMFYCYQYNIR
jgi:long-chain acyl-CoA synthetase